MSWSWGPVVLDVEQDESCSDDRTDSPRAQADSSQGSESRFEHVISAFTDGAFVSLVGVALLVDAFA